MKKIAIGLALAGCAEGMVEGANRSETAERAGDASACQSLGYFGICVDGVGIWYEGSSCRVRDCEGEGKTCGLISNEVGYGCLEGTAGSSAFSCSDVGYEGECLSGDVLVWAEGGACRWADCASYGQSCGWRDSVGFDCVEGGGEEGGGVVPPASGDLLTITQIVGGGYDISQDYGPTGFVYDYDYCHAYGDWGGQHVHCGTDVSIAYGTPMYVPADGTVMIAGESMFFEDVGGNPAAGELKIKFDRDGAEVVMGHMSRIDFATGQRVSAGQLAGLSGSENGPHVHLEVRLPDAAIGLRTVDPVAYFGE